MWGSWDGRGQKQTHSSEKGLFNKRRQRLPPWRGAGPRRPGASRKKGRCQRGACHQRPGAACEASLPLHQPHELADVLSKQLRLLKGSEVAPTGHVGVGDEFRVLEPHPLLWDVQ